MPHKILNLLDRMVEAKVLRPVDLGFSAFLLQQDPGADAKVILGGALTSWRLGLGHVCLDPLADLSSFLSSGVRAPANKLLPKLLMSLVFVVRSLAFFRIWPYDNVKYR